MVYNAKEQILRAKFFMDIGIRMGLVRISQQWIEDARLNHRVTSISLIPHWQKPANLCAWTITKKTKCLPWIIASIPYFLQFFLEKSQFLLGTLLPPVKLDLINFSKNCNFSNFSQFLEKSQKMQKLQFLLDTLLLPMPLDLINFSKNCDFSNFSQFLEKLQKSQLLLDTLVPPVILDLINFSKNCDFSNFSQFLEKSQKLQKSQFLLDTLLQPLLLEFRILAKTAISPIFRNFCYCVQTWTYLFVRESSWYQWVWNIIENEFLIHWAVGKRVASLLEIRGGGGGLKHRGGG